MENQANDDSSVASAGSDSTITAPEDNEDMAAAAATAVSSLPKPSIESQPHVLSWLQELPVIGPLARSLAIEETRSKSRWNANFNASSYVTSHLHEDATVARARYCFVGHLKPSRVKIHDVTRNTIWIPEPKVIWQITFSPAKEEEDSTADDGHN